MFVNFLFILIWKAKACSRAAVDKLKCWPRFKEGLGCGIILGNLCAFVFDFGRLSSGNLNLCWFFLDIPAFRFIYVQLLILLATCLVQRTCRICFLWTRHMNTEMSRQLLIISWHLENITWVHCAILRTGRCLILLLLCSKDSPFVHKYFRYFLIQFQFKFVSKHPQTELKFTFLLITQQTVAAGVSYPL